MTVSEETHWTKFYMSLTAGLRGRFLYVYNGQLASVLSMEEEA